MSFFEPESLFGVVCKRGSGGVDVSFEGLDFTVDSKDALMFSATLFGEIKNAVFLGKTEMGGISLEHFSGVREDGSEISVYIDGKTELPIKLVGEVQGQRICLDIISFERGGG